MSLEDFAAALFASIVFVLLAWGLGNALQAMVLAQVARDVEDELGEDFEREQSGLRGRIDS